MNLKPFLKQPATFDKLLSRDPYGKPHFAPPLTIMARITTKVKTNPQAQEVTLLEHSQILTDVPLAIGDRINGEELQAIETMVDFGGKTIGYKGHPRPPSNFTRE